MTEEEELEEFKRSSLTTIGSVYTIVKQTEGGALMVNLLSSEASLTECVIIEFGQVSACKAPLYPRFALLSLHTTTSCAL